MCGRYTLTKGVDAVQARFNVLFNPGLYKSRYNVAPTQTVPAITNHDGQNQGEFMRWGLVPVWAKDIKIGYRMINARAETLGEKSAWARLLKRRRCLIPADGFYEWKKDGSKSGVPHRIVIRGEDLFAFAGLWDEWRSPEGETIRSCSIITTESNALIVPIHDRMPVILHPEAEEFWLDTALEDLGILTRMLACYPAEDMEAYPVSTLVNRAGADVPECVARVT